MAPTPQVEKTAGFMCSLYMPAVLLPARRHSGLFWRAVGPFCGPVTALFLPGIGAANHTVLIDTRPQMADNGRDAKEADYGALSLYPDRP